MTDQEYKEKCPIGTKIRYTGCHHADVGKEGTTVGYSGDGVVKIVILKSDLALHLFGDSEHSWTTFIKWIEILPQEGQMLFDFYKRVTHATL